MSGISYVNGGANTGGGTNGTVTVTYSPTAGNIVWAFVISVTITVSPTSVKDNNSNALSFLDSSVFASPNVYAYYGTAISGATSYTVSWTGTGAITLLIVEYSVTGGTMAVSATNHTHNHSPGTLSNPTIALTSDDNKDVIVGCFGASLSGYTFSSGAMRQYISSGTGRGACGDITATAASQLNTLTATNQATTWEAVAGEIRFIAASSGNRPHVQMF
jgi:hypothetical protein